MKTTKWPVKTRELHSNHFNSTVWNDFKFRDDDIVIATYAKSGTTWMQQIISQLVFNGEKDLPVAEMSPWVDLRVPPAPVKLAALEEQKHRRFVKTHLPLDALVYSPKAKYIYVARDGRDVVWSLYNHHTSANEKWYGALNDTPGLVGPKMPKPVASVEESFHEWMEKDGYPWHSFWENVKSWWSFRHLPNLHFVNFTSLKNDMGGEIRKIASFLDIPIDETKWDDIMLHCSFDYMRNMATGTIPVGGAFWDSGAKSFINKGVNGRWKDRLTSEESSNYERVAVDKLGKECAEWLKTGDRSLLA